MLDQAYEACSAKWWKYAFFKCRRSEDADEIVQDAIKRTLKAGPPVETVDEAIGYVWVVLKQTSVRTVVAARTRIRTEPFVAGGPTDQGAGSSPLDLLLMAENRREWERKVRLAEEHVKDLPKPIRECIELHIMREPPMRLREIAEKLGIGKSTVGDRVHRGLELLAKAMREDEEN